MFYFESEISITQELTLLELSDITKRAKYLLKQYLSQ